VNGVELLPIAEFETRANWGYGTSHFFATDQGAGGTDRLKMFVKACHRRGIVVILDVCYNHFDPDGERVEWAYDSNDPSRNIYYWYEGRPSDYSDPSGGYIDNISTGWAPRFDEEAVRQLFISSAAFLVAVCHVDGFRLDQTSSIHQYPALHAKGQHAGRAAAFGVKFLKQWTRTMRLIKPGLFLSAEDYSDWSALTQPSLVGEGLGFDATGFGDFHHNLVEYKGGAQAQLLRQAGFGDGRPLAMSIFAGALQTSGRAKIVYSESHDDCGNREGSARTIVVAVDGAPLLGDTRYWAEARARFAAAMMLLSAGTPMFFMGEEIGAQKPYRYSDFLMNREDILGEAARNGAKIFRCYRDLIDLSLNHSAIRSRNIDVPIVHDANRVVAFHRWDDRGEFFIAGSLANAAYKSGYLLSSLAWAMRTGKRSSIPIRIATVGGTSAMPGARSGPSGAPSTSCCPPAACWFSGGDNGGCGCTPRREALASATSGSCRPLRFTRRSARQLVTPVASSCCQSYHRAPSTASAKHRRCEDPDDKSRLPSTDVACMADVSRADQT
jgi:1,4-alpha-glucan branching enzyme